MILDNMTPKMKLMVNITTSQLEREIRYCHDMFLKTQDAINGVRLPHTNKDGSRLTQQCFLITEGAARYWKVRRDLSRQILNNDDLDKELNLLHQLHSR